MLVRYRTTSAITLADFKSDLDGIIQGTITSVGQLSTAAQTYSTVYGSYPTGKYTRVNGTSYTYSKVHNTVGSKTHYFRLNFGATGLDTVSLARAYTSGTDTLLNSTDNTLNFVNYVYDSSYPTSFDIIINDKMIAFVCGAAGIQYGVIDIGQNGMTLNYTDSMLMTHFDFNNIHNENIATYETQKPVFKTTSGGSVPYTYNIDTLAYGTLTYGITTTIPYKRVTSVGGTLSIVENPTYIDCPNSAYASHLLYGVYRIPTNSFAGTQVYKDSNNLYRLTVNDFILLVD